MKNKHQISALVWMAMGILVCIISYRLNLGNWHQPGPGFLPFWAGLVLALLSAAVFIQARLQFQPGSIASEKAKGFFLLRKWKVVATMGALFAYSFFIDFLGFALGTFLLFTFLLWGVERIKNWKALSASILATICLYLIFQVWLNVQMPSGFLR